MFCGTLLLVISLLGVVFVSVDASYSQSTVKITPRPVTDDVVRVETNLVTVPVRVVDRQGHFISNLRKEQFRILEDGIEQQVAYFENYDNPLTICMLIDISDSAKFKLDEIKSAASNFIQKLKTEDRVIVVTFDREVTVLNDGATGNRNRLMQAVNDIKVGGGTSVYNAVDTSLRQILDKAKGRKALVVFSDGVDTTSASATYESTLNIAVESNSAVYAIVYDTYSDVTENARRSSLSQEQMSMRIGNEPARLVYERASRYLRELTALTGGQIFEAGSSGHLSADFDKVLKHLREQYSVGFYPPDVDKTGGRRITVQISIPNAKVNARRYYSISSGTFDTSK